MAGRKSPTLHWLARVAEALETDLTTLLQLGEPTGSPKGAVPLYTLRAAAGTLGSAREVEPIGWVQPSARRPVRPNMFAAQVVGKSMEPLIPSGALCLFRRLDGGDPERRIVLVQHRDIHDVETGGSYTVKRFTRKTGAKGRIEVRLESLNPKFPPIVLTEKPGTDVKVIAEFVEVISDPRGPQR